MDNIEEREDSGNMLDDIMQESMGQYMEQPIDFKLFNDTLSSIMKSEGYPNNSLLNESVYKGDNDGDEVDDESQAKVPGKQKKIRQKVKRSITDYEKEVDGDVDEKLTELDMLAILYSEIKRKRIAGHHLDSMNSFNSVGINQIATKIFTIEGRQRNKRDSNEEDQSIEEISFKVDITDTMLTPPKNNEYSKTESQMMTPSLARMQGLTYSANLFITADITATAYLKNGTTKVRTSKIENHKIASIPCMVGSNLCNTSNLSKESLRNLEEDPLSPGGYFIIKGFEWVIDNLENNTNNTFHVYKNMFKIEMARGTFLSKAGDDFENSYQVIMRYLNTGSITIEITVNKNDKLDIPFYLIFRALGMTKDKDIINHIVYGVDNQDEVTKSMLEILEGAFDANDEKFNPIKNSVNPVEIINFIANKITENANSVAAKRDDNIIKHINNNVLHIIDKYIFPHIGTEIDDRIKKLRFIGHLINKLLSVYLGVQEASDRDSYRNKRIFSAGTSVAKAFKTDFNFTVVQEIKKKLMKEFKQTPFSNVNLAASVVNAIASDDLEKMLIQAITTGNKTITIKKNEIINRVSSQILYHKNDMNVKSTLNTINTPSTTSSKQNERADEMRRVHPTYLGFIDVSQSADTGEKVGMTKQMCTTASVCGASSSFVLKSILENDEDIIDLDDIRPEMISQQKLAKVFVNGDWIGCCKESHNLVYKYRQMRRNGDIHYQTTIVWEILIREVYFWTDFGRLLRPMLIVYNNIEDYIENWRHGDRTMKFKQWIKLTKDHVLKLRNNELTMEDLRKDKIIEYISPEEQENAFECPNITTLRQNVNNLQRKYTHIDIDQAIYGIVTTASPLANHSNATRITFYTNHRKQSAGWFALNYPYRMDKNVTLQHYCERPLISTFSDALTYPNGHNVIAAVDLHLGEGQEDSVELNQSSIDCGMFNASYYTYEKVELEKGEQFGNPDYSRTMEINKEYNYEHIKNGFVEEGTIVHKGDILVVRVAKIVKPVDKYQWVDRSLVYKHSEPAYVEKVVITRNEDGFAVAKVKLRSDRPLLVGDKMSSRHGNKGIVSCKMPRSDMTYCEDGMVPDIIINAHSFPTRMAINQIIESVYGQEAAIEGTHIDATSFMRIDIDELVKSLDEKGIKYGGHRRMYSGLTGEWRNVLIFIGMTTYQRLQKYVLDENYAIRNGPTSAITRQPVDGKTNDGGLKLGKHFAQGDYKMRL